MRNVTPHAPHKTVRTAAFAATATAVTALSIAERGLGFLYRVVLARLLGAEGLGLYQVALSLFAVFLTIGTGGIPISVSRLIVKGRTENQRLAQSATVASGLLLCLLLTLPVMFLFGVFPSAAGVLFTDERCVPVFRILLLGLVLSAAYAVLRGGFWGDKKFLLPSVLELAEETVMVIAGVLLLRGVENALDGAKIAAWAVVVSYAFSFLAATLCYFLGGGRLSSPKRQLKPLFNASLPITSVRASGSLVNSAVAVLLPAMLVRTGMSQSNALTLFGLVSGMAMPVLFIPATVIGSLSLVLVPELSQDYYGKHTARLHANLSRGLSAAFLVACFLMPFFYALGDDLGALAFSEPLVGEFIKKGCPILLPMSLTMISTGMLNSMGFERQTFVFYFIGAAVMLLCVLLLPAVCGAYAYVIGLGASYVVSAACNLVFLGKKCQGLYKKMWRQKGYSGIFPLIKALVCVLPLSLLGGLLRAVFSHVFGAFLCAVVTGTVLALCTFVIYSFIKALPLQMLFAIFTKRKKRDNRAKTGVFK